MASMVLTALAAIWFAPTASAQHTAGLVEVPLRVEAGRLMVPVHAADGTEYHFMLSTGTPPTILSASTAAALGDSPELTLGGLAVDFTGSQTISDEDLAMEEFTFHGMIGPQTLNRYDILIDVPGGRLVLRPAGPPAAWEGVTLTDPAPIQVFHGQVMAMNVEIDGQSVFATFDSGRRVAAANEALVARLGAEPEFTATVAFGGSEIPGLTLQQSEIPMNDRWDPDGRGFLILGAAFTYDCAVAISWVRSQLQVCAR
jgi:hypothetical protein